MYAKMEKKGLKGRYLKDRDSAFSCSLSIFIPSVNTSWEPTTDQAPCRSL